MTVKFYILQRDGSIDSPTAGKTREKFLFNNELTELAVGKRITHMDNNFEVKTLEFIGKTLKAVCWEVLQ